MENPLRACHPHVESEGTHLAPGGGEWPVNEGNRLEVG